VQKSSLVKIRAFQDERDENIQAQLRVNIDPKIDSKGLFPGVNLETRDAIRKISSRNE